MAAFFRAWRRGVGIAALLGMLAFVGLITLASLRETADVELLRFLGAPDRYLPASSSAMLCSAACGRADRLRAGAADRHRPAHSSRRMELAESIELGLRLLDWVLLACVPAVSALLVTGSARMTALHGLARCPLSHARPSARSARALMLTSRSPSSSCRPAWAGSSRSPRPILCSTSASGCGPVRWSLRAAAAALPPRWMVAHSRRLWKRACRSCCSRIVGLDLRGARAGAHPGGRGLRLQAPVGLGDPGAPPPVRDPAIALKRELTRIPLFGWYLMHAGMIRIDREGDGRCGR